MLLKEIKCKSLAASTGFNNVQLMQVFFSKVLNFYWVSRRLKPKTGIGFEFEFTKMIHGYVNLLACFDEFWDQGRVKILICKR